MSGEPTLETKIEYIDSPNSPVVLHGGYSHVVRFEDLVFVSGQLPFDPATGDLASDDVAGQTARVLENLQAALVAAGSDLHSILKVEIQILDRSYWGDMNEVYCRYIESPRPPRTTRVSAMAEGVLVEIDCIAVTSRN